MSRDKGHREAVTGGRAGADAWAARPETGAEARSAAGWPGAGGGRSGLAGLWLLLVPLACCGGPLLIAALAAARALAWGAAGLGAGVLAAVTVLVIRRSRRGSRACREPGMTGLAQQAQTAATRRPPVR
jgi:hypothetical protein